MNSVPGKIFLKVAGILLVIFGFISAMIVVSEIYGYWPLFDEDQATGFTFDSVYNWMSSFFSIMAGVYAVKFCNDLDKANLLSTLGSILVGFQVGHGISQATSGEFVLLIYAIGLIFPVMYVIGAQKNLKAGKN